MSLKWHHRYLALAGHISEWSRDPSSKIGAIAVGSDKQILATGYNGFPRGIEDTSERLDNREIKYSMTIHAEMNCIYNASLTGISLKGSSIYIHGLPVCSSCSLGIIQAGISCVVIRENDINKSEKWKDSWELSKSLLDEAGVDILIL